MTPPWWRSATFRLAAAYAAFFAASTALLLGLVYWSTAGLMARQTDDTIEAEIATLAERYRADGLAGLVRLLERQIAREPLGGPIYLLTDAGRRRLGGNLESWPRVEPDTAGWLSFDLGERGPSGIESHPARARAFRLEGGLQLLVGRDVRALRKLEALFTRASVAGVGLIVVLALAGGIVVARTSARRVEAIDSTAREIMAGDLERRIPRTGSGDEFDRLAESLNAMLDRIQALMDELRRISDNVAHDLRTPLTRLRHHLEELSAHPAGNQPAVEAAIGEADALLSTFNALVRIARVRASERRAALAPVDLGALAGDVVELYEPVAETRGQHITLDTTPGAVVRGDRDMLFQAVGNLVDNAIKHGPTGGSIRLAVARDAAAVSLQVADDGPGIPAAARERVLEPFYRLEQARHTPGNGLGLSLVAAVARVHGATLALDGEHGLVVTMAFRPGPPGDDLIPPPERDSAAPARDRPPHPATA